MIEFLLEPFTYGFMRSALFALTMIALTSSILGAYVVLRRMAFIGDALAHTALPGVVSAYLLGWNLFLGALVAGILTSLGISWFTRNKTIREDTAIGVVFTGMFALGILMISTVRSFRDFNHILFGNILGVSDFHLLGIAVVTFIILAILLLIQKELEWTTVDPVHSATLGLSPAFIRTLLLLLLAMAVTMGIQAAGVVLTSALLITPPAAASLLTKKLGKMMLLSSVISILSGIIGLYLSFYANISSGASIVLTATVFFGASWIFKFFKDRQCKEIPGSEALS